MIRASIITRLALAALLCLLSGPSLATGPLDVVAGAAFCFGLAECSEALAAAGANAANVFVLNPALLTSSAPSTVELENCSIRLAAGGQLDSTVSGCSGSGASNGTRVSAVCPYAFDSAVPQRAAPGACPASVNSFMDQISGVAYFGYLNPVIGAYTPTLVLNAFNGNPAWSFNGINQWFRANVFMSDLIGSGASPSFTVVLRLKPTQLTSGKGYVMVGATPTGCVLVQPANVCGDGNGYFKWYLIGQSGNATGQMVVDNANFVNIGHSTCTISVNTWHWVAFSYDGKTGAWAFYADRAACGSGTTSGISFTHNDGYPALLGGGDAGENMVNLYRGQIRALLPYKRVLNPTDIYAVMATEAP